MILREPFIIFALPRSRTAWLSRWLSYGGLQVDHDRGVLADSVQEFLDDIHRVSGTVETGAMIAHRLLRLAMPTAKFVVIRRPVREVEASLARYGITDVRGELERRNALLDELEDDGVRSIRYDDLQDVKCCADLFEHLLEVPFDFRWWRSMDEQNVQIDVANQIQILAERAPQIAHLKSEVASLLSQKNPELVVIRWESVDSWLRDGKPLFAEHFSEVNNGERDGHPFRLNEALVRQSADGGMFRVLTARVNGKLCGYITWSFKPDTESEGVVIADQGAWFVSESAPHGIGRRLLDRSLADLRTLGVNSIELHHQLNGRGAQLGKLFKRLGAIEHQHRYSLLI